MAEGEGACVIKATFFVRQTACRLIVRAEFAGQGPKGRQHTQVKRFADSAKFQTWIRDWLRSCKAVGIPVEYTIQAEQ